MDISIIIVNWNTRDLLAECLKSLEQNLDEALKYEVIVVDNGSSDGSADMVKRQFPSVSLIANKVNLGFVRANNQGALIAKGRYILLLNSDTVVLDKGIKEIISYLDTHRDVGVATGRVLYPDGRFQRPFARFPHWFGAIFRNTTHLIIKIESPFYRRYRLDHLDEMSEHDVDCVFGAYLFVRKNLLYDGKVFDEDMYMWSEDTLLCHRIRERGYRVIYLPCAPIIHYAGQSRRKIPSESAYNSFKGSVIYFQKINGESQARFYSFTVRLIWCALAMSFTILQVLPVRKFKEKAQLFKSLISRGPVL